jgi:hypothetical protein
MSNSGALVACQSFIYPSLCHKSADDGEVRSHWGEPEGGKGTCLSSFTWLADFDPTPLPLLGGSRSRMEIGTNIPFQE